MEFRITALYNGRACIPIAIDCSNLSRLLTLAQANKKKQRHRRSPSLSHSFHLFIAHLPQPLLSFSFNFPLLLKPDLPPPEKKHAWRSDTPFFDSIFPCHSPSLPCSVLLHPQKKNKMRLNYGISSALLLVLAHTTIAHANDVIM